MKRLLAPAVLAVAFFASLPAQNTGTVGTPASFHDKAKAELAVELIKKYEGVHDRSDYPYYSYGHCKLPGEELSYDMTEAEAEKLLIRDLEKRYRLFSKYGRFPYPDRTQLQCGSRNSARIWETSEKPSAEKDGSRWQGHL